MFTINIGNLSLATERLVACLLIVCPCAFGLGAPLIIARAFELGLQDKIIFKSQRAIENLAIIKKAFFDKTGTLTKLNNDINFILVSDRYSKEFIYQIVSGVDEYSSHHICKALASLTSSVKDSKIANFSEKIAYGVSYERENILVKIGRKEFVGIVGENSEFDSFISFNDEVVAQFGISEQLETGAVKLIEGLKGLSIESEILSGDRQKKVDVIASKLKLNNDRCFGELSPSNKYERINTTTDTSMMVGNGINDSMAMSKSMISIAVNGASELAKESSDVVLMTDDLRALYRAILIAKSCRAVLVRGLSFAVLFNLIGVSLAATGFLKPVVAAILMPISSLTILYISTRWE